MLNPKAYRYLTMKAQVAPMKSKNISFDPAEIGLLIANMQDHQRILIFYYHM